MVFLETNFRSKLLTQSVSVNVLLPEPSRMVPPPYKTLWLLHGLSDDHTAWLRNTSIERYAEKYGIAVIMPAVNRSWYTDTQYDAKYFQFITDELPFFCRECFNHLSIEREDNLIGGLSMGGYGALKAALSRPDNYFACISLSGALDITRKDGNYNINEWKSIFGFNISSSLELEGSRHDLFAIAAKNKRQDQPFPKIYMWCGSDDRLIETNREFHKHLTDLDIEHTFEVSEGNHTWKWWDIHIENALRNIFGY